MMSYLPALLGHMYCPSDEWSSAWQVYVEPLAAQEREEHLKHCIEDRNHFDSLARLEGSGASGVKIVRDTAGVLHFMDTKAWPYHYPFCVTFLKEQRPLETFNEQVYTGKDRSMMFATIVAYPKGDKETYYCLEFNPADPMTPGLDKIAEFFTVVTKSFMSSQQVLYFHPTSAAQIETIRDKKLSIPVIQSSQLFGDIPYKVVQTGQVKNKVVAIFNKNNYTQEELQTWLNKRSAEEIVIIPSVPNDIPAVGGVICNEVIPPLCHVALLCQNRKTPCCYRRDATTQFMNAQMECLVVSGTIANVGFTLDGRSRGSKAESDSVQPISVEAVDTKTTQFIDLDSFKASNAYVVGAKAAQLAKVNAMYGQLIFNGTFVVPFHHYNKHVNDNQTLIKEGLHPILSKLGTVTSAGARSPYANKGNNFDYNIFSDFVNKIIATPIDNELVQSVIDKIVENNWTSVIFRSSTNAEDLTGFNGAGLYESVPLSGDDVTNPERVGRALKTVWASVWSPKAVKERQYYKMNHRKVQMAVLIQPYICDRSPDVKVLMNGVCITHDTSRHKIKHGFVVHTFPGSEYKVTNHYKDATPESVTLFLNRQKDSIDMQLHSLCNKATGPLLTQSDTVKMVEVFGKLHNMIVGSPHSMNSTMALDIEFMIVDNKVTKIERDLVVLQARPYQVNVAPEGVDYDEERVLRSKNS